MGCVWHESKGASSVGGRERIRIEGRRSGNGSSGGGDGTTGDGGGDADGRTGDEARLNLHDGASRGGRSWRRKGFKRNERTLEEWARSEELARPRRRQSEVWVVEGFGLGWGGVEDTGRLGGAWPRNEWPTAQRNWPRGRAIQGWWGWADGWYGGRNYGMGHCSHCSGHFVTVAVTVR